MRTRMIRGLTGVLLLLASLMGSGAGLLPAAAAPPAAPVLAAPDTGCTMNFSDVPTGSLFYTHIQYLYCSGVVGGYSDGTFRPNNATTRGQLAKMISLALHWPTDYSGAPHFADVPATNIFFGAIEAAYAHGIIGGYACGHTGEPCDSNSTPYFRPGAPVTRGQLAKMVVLAHGWSPTNAPQPTFADVPADSTFYAYVETAAAQSVVGGYADGTFRPANSATRAQLSKMIYTSVAPPAFDQTDNESELQASDDSAEELPQDLDPGADSGPGGYTAQKTEIVLTGTATISGTLQAGGNPLVGAQVVARPVGGGSPVTGLTDGTGNYSLSVPAGSYNISAALFSAMYPVTAYPNNPVTVADGGTATAGFSLTQGGVLAGTVSDAGSSAPIAGANTWAVPAPLPPQAYGGSLSDAQGHYRLVVPAGSVAAWAGKPSDTYPRTGPVGSNPISVTAGMTTTVDFALQHGGVVIGHITDASTAAPLAGARVWARHDPFALAYGAPLTDGSGAYRLVVPGGLTLNLHAHDIDGMYPDTLYSENPISVTTGMTITADLALTQGGLITGVISGADTNQPLGGARAIAHEPVARRYWSWWSDPQGHYRLVVPAGSWNVFGRADWAGYYRTPAANNPVSVTVGSTVTLDLSLNHGAIIEGRVTDATTHTGLPYTHVWATTPGPGGPNYGWHLSGPDGRYLLAVPAGTWGLFGRNDLLGYPRTAYPGNPLTVTVGSRVTADLAMTQGARIVGQITDSASGLPIAGAAVWARAPGGGLGYGGPNTDDQGRYVVVVPAGSWVLRARDLADLYPRGTYPGNPVTTTVGATVPASWTLTKGGQITGQITEAAGGTGLGGAQVWAREVAGNARDADLWTAPDGTYHLVVPAGIYNLRAAAILQGYPSLAYPTNPVTVTVGGTTLASWALPHW